MATVTLPGVLLSGTNGSRPAANTVASGTLYAETDTGQAYQSNGSSWTAWGAPASGIVSAASNPGGPAAGDLCFRSDLGYLIYYDGTRWLTVAEYMSGMTATLPGMTADNTLIYAPVNATYDIYVTTVDVSTFVATTNDGTKYWTCTANKTNSANSNTSLGSFNTSADSVSTWAKHAITVSAVVTSAGYWAMNVTAAKTSTPGALYFAAQFRYRLVIT